MHRREDTGPYVAPRTPTRAPLFRSSGRGCEAIRRPRQKPDVELDPLGTGTFMVCGLPEAKDLHREERESDPSRFPYVVLVTVKPEEVNVFQQYGDHHRLRSAREIVRWVLAHYKVRIEDDLMTDWTARVAAEGVDVLYPKAIR